MKRILTTLSLLFILVASSCQPTVIRADFNGDEIVNSPDLLSFLTVYGRELPKAIIPYWINWNQDIICNTVPYARPFELVDGEMVEFTESDSLVWYYDGIRISSGDSLFLETYSPDSLLENTWNINCDGWQLPCDGMLDITLRVYHNGWMYERTAPTLMVLASQPDWLPNCDELCCPPNLFFGPFEPYEFLITNGNQ